MHPVTHNLSYYFVFVLYRIGTGSKILYLANGVGTGLFMWYPIFKILLSVHPKFFEKYTLIAPSFRGLFREREDVDDRGISNYEVSIAILADDVKVIMNHAGVNKFQCLIGWSLGAQTVIQCLSNNPNITFSLFLLNPSTGRTLHSVLQPFMKLPNFVGNFIAFATRVIYRLLYPICMTSVWSFLRWVVYSTVFHMIFIVTAFLGGYPPEQPSYFSSYCKDIFYSRFHTQVIHLYI